MSIHKYVEPGCCENGEMKMKYLNRNMTLYLSSSCRSPAIRMKPRKVIQTALHI